MWQFLTVLISGVLIMVDGHSKRSIDLIATRDLISDQKLSGDTVPRSYHLFLRPLPSEGYFQGTVKINVLVMNKTREIILHAHPNLQIEYYNVTQLVPPEDGVGKTPTPVNIESADRVKNKPLLNIVLQSPVKPGTVLEVHLQFTGKLFNDTSEGLFRTSYVDSPTNKTKWLVATHMRPNMARSVFPCYDEPVYKVPMVVSVARQRNMTAVSNMPLESTKPHESMTDWVWDTFRKSPPMSTFSLGIVVSEFSYISSTIISNNKNISLRVWARPDAMNNMRNVSSEVEESLKVLDEFWGIPFPLPQLDIFAVPCYQSSRPADGWGLIVFEEHDLLTVQGSWLITNELVFQWLGSLTSPLWWSQASINQNLVQYITLHAIQKINEKDDEPSKNWHITILYSIYYGLSQRYPFRNSTIIRATSGKDQYIFRMLNYTLGEETFVRGIQRLISKRQLKTFVEDDIWTSLTEQARIDEKLPQPITVSEIASSWITQERLPLVTVTRNYKDNTATLKQQVYLRERPHDVPDQEKFLWWIPIVLVKQDNMEFHKTTPYVWMKKEREIKIDNLPGEQSFIIVNPEEIGPFPVNYDTHNWYLLSTYLCSENRAKIPLITRAKLLHDAWNLAYAGDLSFATALNFTVCLKHEREVFVWERLFTMIDHVGRLIDGTTVHKKFQTYAIILLSSLYEELGKESKEGERKDIDDLRRTTKAWLMGAGYKPFVDEALKSFRNWIETPYCEEESPAGNQYYLCPVFKWGTYKEWEQGLERLMQYPTSKKPRERYYLLKTLAGCPDDANRIEKLLNITVLEQNGNFTDNDISLIFSMLTGSTDGYKNLFHFLKKNWDTIRARFDKKPDLWNDIIDSATTLFKTQEGLDLVSDLYAEKKGQFGTADSIITNGLKTIREEVKWSNQNYPVMEAWLDQYMKTNHVESVA